MLKFLSTPCARWTVALACGLVTGCGNGGGSGGGAHATPNTAVGLALQACAPTWRQIVQNNEVGVAKQFQLGGAGPAPQGMPGGASNPALTVVGQTGNLSFDAGTCQIIYKFSVFPVEQVLFKPGYTAPGPDSPLAQPYQGADLPAPNVSFRNDGALTELSTSAASGTSGS